MKKFLKEFEDLFFEHWDLFAIIILIIAGVVLFGCLLLPMLIVLARDTWAFALK